jgi:nicotinamide mononucleotide transporter
VNLTEIIAALLGVANIVLLIRRSLWNYPFGIAMVVLYGVVFFQARLYSDAALQVFFLVIQLYGWWKWARARDGAGAVPVGWMTGRQRLVWAAAALLGGLADGWLLSHYTPDVAPWLDATTTALSVAAQFLLSLRRIENWLLWILVDIISVALYLWRGLLPTTALYAVFMVLAIAGLLQWRRTPEAA